MYVSDLLSKTFTVKPQQDDAEMIEMVHNFTKHLQISDFRKREFREPMLADAGLSKVLKYWNEGWPTNCKNIPFEALGYFKYTDNIYVEEKLLFLNEIIIVPVSLRAEMQNLIHAAYCVMQKAKARDRQILFWPEIAKILKI